MYGHWLYVLIMRSVFFNLLLLMLFWEIWCLYLRFRNNLFFVRLFILSILFWCWNWLIVMLNNFWASIEKGKQISHLNFIIWVEIKQNDRRLNISVRTSKTVNLLLVHIWWLRLEIAVRRGSCVFVLKVNNRSGASKFKSIVVYLVGNSITCRGL